MAITSDFTGADLTIFGALDNADPLLLRQGRYDVVVVLEGPARPVVVRKKTRVLGMWINTESETFVNVPVSYSVATTRQPQDITDTESYRQLSLGADYIYLQPLIAATAGWWLLGEHLTPAVGGAAAFIFVGIRLVARRPRRAATLPQGTASR